MWFLFPPDGVMGTTFDDYLQMSFRRQLGSPEDAALAVLIHAPVFAEVRPSMEDGSNDGFDRGKAHIWLGTGDVDLDRGIEQWIWCGAAGLSWVDNLLRWCLRLPQNRWVDEGVVRRRGMDAMDGGLAVMDLHLKA